MRKTGALILLASVAYFLHGCRYDEIKYEAPQVNTVEAGAKFRINLPEDHREGYLWQLRQDYDRGVVEQLNEAWHGNEKGIDFNMRGRGAGQTTLTFVQRKYRDTSDIKHFIVKIGDN
jgi:hypothetical protein